MRKWMQSSKKKLLDCPSVSLSMSGKALSSLTVPLVTMICLIICILQIQDMSKHLNPYTRFCCNFCQKMNLRRTWLPQNESGNYTSSTCAGGLKAVAFLNSCISLFLIQWDWKVQIGDWRRHFFVSKLHWWLCDMLNGLCFLQLTTQGSRLLSVLLMSYGNIDCLLLICSQAHFRWFCLPMLYVLHKFRSFEETFNFKF